VAMAAVVVLLGRPRWSQPLLRMAGLHRAAPAPITNETPRQEKSNERRRPVVAQPVGSGPARAGDTQRQPGPRVVPQRVEPRPSVTASITSTAQQDDPTADYMDVGVLYARKGRYQEAEELFRKVVDQNPTSAEARNNLGFVYLQQEKYDLAERQFRDALKFDPQYVLAYYNLACLYARKQMDVEAILYLKRAAEKDERVKLWAADDEDFESLMSDEVFRELIGLSVEHRTKTGRR